MDSKCGAMVALLLVALMLVAEASAGIDYPKRPVAVEIEGKVLFYDKFPSPRPVKLRPKYYDGYEDLGKYNQYPPEMERVSNLWTYPGIFLP